MRPLVLTFSALLGVVGFVGFAPAASACDDPSGCGSPQPTYDPSGTAELVALANQERAGAGLAPLAMRADIAEIAAAHTAEMAKSGTIYHNDAYFSSATRTRLGLKALGENVGMAGSVRGAHQALMNSAPHRANILNGSFTVGGFAVVSDGGAFYVTEAFGTPSGAPRAAGTPVAAPAAPKPPVAAKPVPKPAAAPTPARAVRRPAPAPPTTPPPPVVEVAAPPAAPEPVADGPDTTTPGRMFTALASAGTSPGPLAFPAVILLGAVASAVLHAWRQSKARLVTAG